MKQILILLFFICVVLSCRKNIDTFTPNVDGDTTKLISITNDSINFSYSYTNNRMTDIYIHYINSPDSNHYAHLDYSDNYIKVSDLQGLNYTEYFLTDLKLPLKIVKYSDYSINPETINFFYKPGTNLLDSVNDIHAQNTYAHYELNYDGENIIEIKQFINSLESDFSYSYDTSTPNIFRQTDSLLYVYTNPFGGVGGGGIVGSDFFGYFPKLFSASTFKTVTYRVAEGAPNLTDTLNYTLNNKGKISSEGYNSNLVINYFYQ
ncbi:MAG: hypothetical protein ACR2FN_04230 [Chitinophagaceae bacterium]